MEKPAAFLLERIVHHVMSEDAQPVRQIVAEALHDGADPRKLLSDVIWPAAECAEQLRHDGLISTRIFNKAARQIFAITEKLDFPKALFNTSTDRHVLIFSAPGEYSDLGSHLLSVLAEAYGFSALFAGARLSFEEITFALSRLEPEAIIIQGSLPSSREGAAEFLRRLGKTRFVPTLQVAVAGAIVGENPQSWTADLVAAHPGAILELLALCPSYRAGTAKASATKPLQMPIDAPPMLDAGQFKHSLLRHFPPRFRQN